MAATAGNNAKAKVEFQRELRAFSVRRWQAVIFSFLQVTDPGTLLLRERYGYNWE